MKNVLKPTQGITNVLFLNSKAFYKNGGCKITLVDKFKDYTEQKGKLRHPVTGKIMAYTQVSRVYSDIPQKICSISFTSNSTFVEMLKCMPIGFPIAGYSLGERQKDSRFYECVDNKFSDNKLLKIQDAIYAYLKKGYKKFWDALCKEYTKNENLLALGKLELPMYEERANSSTKKKEEKKDDGILTVAEFQALSRIQEMQKYARGFGVTGRSKQDLVDRLKAKGKLK
jgi:hypothetical protein